MVNITVKPQFTAVFGGRKTRSKSGVRGKSRYCLHCFHRPKSKTRKIVSVKFMANLLNRKPNDRHRLNLPSSVRPCP